MFEDSVAPKNCSRFNGALSQLGSSEKLHATAEDKSGNV